MKIKEEFELVTIGSEGMLIPVGDEAERFNGMYVMNEETTMVIRLLREELTMEALLDALLAEYDLTPDAARQHLETLTMQLNRMGLLESVPA